MNDKQEQNVIDVLLDIAEQLVNRSSDQQQQINKQENQIGRLIQCIGEFDLSEQQRYYLHKAIWGDDDE